MIAAFLELDHSLASVAPLPSFLLGLLEEPAGLFVPRALARIVHLGAAPAADLGLASAAFAVLPAIGVAADVLGLDPVAAAPRRAVDPVSGRELGVLLVPRPLEVSIEQLLDVLERDVVGRAALGRHVLRVVDGEPEAPLEARVAHSVSALQPRAPLRQNLLVHADNAFNTGVPN